MVLRSSFLILLSVSVPAVYGMENTPPSPSSPRKLADIYHNLCHSVETGSFARTLPLREPGEDLSHNILSMLQNAANWFTSNNEEDEKEAYDAFFALRDLKNNSVCLPWIDDLEAILKWITVAHSNPKETIYLKMNNDRKLQKAFVAWAIRSFQQTKKLSNEWGETPFNASPRDIFLRRSGIIGEPLSPFYAPPLNANIDNFTKKGSGCFYQSSEWSAPDFNPEDEN
jgi:hypothetical protein